MNEALLSAVLVASLALQTLLPRLRLLVVGGGAALSCLAAALLGVASTREIFAELPWDVLLILVGLGLMTEVIAETGLFGVLAAAATRRSGGRPRGVLALFAIIMYGVSALVNNLTALLLVLPILLILLKLLGVRQRYVSWTLGVVLVACNLGGAATPIGDFPAILLLGQGAMSFSAYLVAAAPPTLAALGALLALTLLVVRPDRDLERDPLARRLSLSVMAALYRKVRVERRLLVPTLVVLGAMLAAWLWVPVGSGIGPELICWVGVGVVLLLRPKVGERLMRSRVDVEAVLFFLSLFVMVGAVRRTGVFHRLAQALIALPLPPAGQMIAFLVLSGLVTGLFSAGPSMAALLEVAQSLATRIPPTAIYVGLALSVCAGSSLFLTAATSGPMAQLLTERAGLRDPDAADGGELRFGFSEFLPVGLSSFVLIQAIAIGWALLLAR